MLGHEPFFHSQFRKYIAVFATLFNDVKVTRREINDSGASFPVDRDDEGDLESLIRVPISYANKSKLLARVLQDPKIERQVAIQECRMAFEVSSIVPNGDLRLGPARDFQVTMSANNDIQKRVLSPSPFKLNFTLWVIAKYQIEAQMIIEQIVPFFNPTFTPSALMIPEMGVIKDVPITLLSVVPEDTYKGEFENRREIIWRMEFVMIADIFGPIRDAPLIKFANVNFYNATLFDDIYDAVGNTPAIDRVTVRPGMDANGNPTSNDSLSVPYAQIREGDDWTYIVDISGILPIEE